MRDRIQAPPGRRQNDLDMLTKWGIAVLLMVVLLTTGYWVIHSAAQLDETRTQLTSTLPANYRDTLKALLVSAGASCRKVCAFTVATASPDRTTFRISCGAATTGDVCSEPQHYMLSVEREPTPSR